jgi:hypothetical protein
MLSFSAKALAAALSIALASATFASAGSLLPGTGGSTEQKICTHTYNPDGTRCTFCYYTTQPGSGGTVCIKIKAPEKQSSSIPSPTRLR